MDKPTHEQFLASVGGHVMTIEHDMAPMRTILFKNPTTFNRYFRITTWHHALCISGDMGCFVFSRLPDMFEFFRVRNGETGINPGYWSEKLIADEPHAGHEAFSEALYYDALREQFRQWRFDDWAQMRRAWQGIRDELWDVLNTHDAFDMVARYRCDETGNRFSDFWETRLEDYTHHYIWCCRAIVWAIDQYDAAKAADNDNQPATAKAS
jgi:hypothetical protein